MQGQTQNPRALGDWVWHVQVAMVPMMKVSCIRSTKMTSAGRWSRGSDDAWLCVCFGWCFGGA